MKNKKRRKNKIAPFIINFCKSISKEQPVLVPLLPIVGKKVNECFTVVPEHILANGGKQKIGWCIHVWRRVLIEAEFHCVWESPERELIDITPKIYKTDFIIFLPDTTKRYTGRQVDNIRKPLSSDKNVSQFIRLCQEHFRYVNKDNLADYHGEVTIKADFIDKHYRMQKLELYLMSKFGNERGYATTTGFKHYHMHHPYQ